MPLWTFKVYCLEGGACPIRDWYIMQEIEVQAAFDATLITLAATEDWEDTKHFKALRREHEGLGEIRFALEKPFIRRFRPVGIWPPVIDREFIFLLGCEKSRGVYDPDGAFDLALHYKHQLEAGIGELHEYR
ncbi:MAG: hypothetical protein ACRD2B_13555 [Terriglobia bacterium]